MATFAFALPELHWWLSGPPATSKLAIVRQVLYGRRPPIAAKQFVEFTLSLRASRRRRHTLRDLQGVVRRQTLTRFR